jgi:hypothetical protein
VIISEPVVVLELDVVLLKRICKLELIVLLEQLEEEGVSILERFVVEDS